jgi:propanol-preferring alcohol dehydrogenase
VINDVPIPEPGKDQFLVKIKSASLCHSDLMRLEQDQGPTTTLGHEGAGVIDKMHPSVEGKGFKIGDAIGFNYFINVCYACDGCQVHNQNCERSEMPYCQGFHVDGFFQEYVVVDYHNAVVLPPELDIRRASPLFCAGITGESGSWHTVFTRHYLVERFCVCKLIATADVYFSNTKRSTP